MGLLSLFKTKNYGRIAHVACERYLNRPLPKWMAKSIARANKKEFETMGDMRLILESYDGSDQVVHPDFLQWKEKLWLVCTPYPYGSNKCENPSIFKGESVETLKPACKNPIDFPSSKTPGSILSDPCFFVRDDKLFVCYRERIQKKDYVAYNLYTKSSCDGVYWTDKTVIKSTITSDNDPLVSPAIIRYNEKDYLYHVRVSGLGGNIVLSLLDEQLEAKEIKVLHCEGLPEGFVIWHIGLHADNYTKTAEKGGNILGLLTVRNGRESRVYKAHQESPHGDWIVDQQVDIPNPMQGNYRELYKCSYTPDGKIALSFFDVKNRLAIVII